MRFTKAESGILSHRLEAADALVECLTDTHPDDPPSRWTPEDVQAAVESVAGRLESGDWEELGDCEREVLRDCVEGSTWIPGCDAQFEQYHTTGRALLGRQIIIGERLAEKVSELLGEVVSIAM